MAITPEYGMRFLIVDDAEAPLKVLHQVITDMGHDVVGSARNGQEAVEAYARLRPDVVIMDLIMPKLNGLEALKVICQSNARASVIIASSLKSCQTALEAERLGASYCLSKPFSIVQLRKIITRLSNKMEPRREKRSSATAGYANPLPSA